MAFKKVSSAVAPPAGPLALFDELPRMPGSIPELWRQQGEILTDYAARFAERQDVAIELPTGTGKTMVGLLIADWRRRRFRHPVLYACPTKQLAHQVAKVAAKEGIPAVKLVGSHRAWPDEKEQYVSADRIGVTTYSSIFNAVPKVGRPGTVIFDDAHAAEQYVAESWSISVDRHIDAAAYQALLKALSPGLGGMYIERMKSDSPDLRASQDVRMVVPLRRASMSPAISKALSKLEEKSGPWWDWQTVAPGLASCLAFVSWREILLRPFVPPTSTNQPFAGADQRVYLSATPGHAGELERAFGRASIDRLLLPDGRTPRSGRRLFVFPDLAKGDPSATASAVVKHAGKALVLATSGALAETSAAEITQPGWPILGHED